MSSEEENQEFPFLGVAYQFIESENIESIYDALGFSGRFDHSYMNYDECTVVLSRGSDACWSAEQYYTFGSIWLLKRRKKFRPGEVFREFVPKNGKSAGFIEFDGNRILHLVQGEKTIETMRVFDDNEMITTIKVDNMVAKKYYKRAEVTTKRNIFKAFLKRLNSTNSLPKKPPAEEINVQKVKLKASDLRRLLSLAKSEKWKIIAAIGCLVISSSITMAVPFGLGKILDIIYSSESANDSGIAKNKLNQFCLFLSVIFIIGGVTNFGRVYLFNNASLRITTRLRQNLYDRMMKQDCTWFDTKGTGELVNRLSTDTYMVGNSLSQNLSDGLRSTAMVIAGTGMMIYTSPNLALVGMCVVPCVAGGAVIYGRFLRNITREYMDKLAEVIKISEERIGNIRTVKIFSRENFENKLFTNELMNMLAIGYRETKARAIFYGMTGLSGNAIIMSVLYYGGTLVNEGQMTIGALTSFILYAGYTAISLGGLSNFYTELNKGVGSATRIWEILDRTPIIPTHGGLIPVEKPRGEIIFDNISFNYPTRADADVLRNMNMKIEAGTITAVVGRSGSGKSSIASLLIRLYDPQSGKIYLDGRNLKELDPSWLRRNIGTVNQEPVLFSGTIRENILYGLEENQTISEEDFQQVIEEAHVSDFVQILPDGLNTVVGQRGMMLSGGQKQRVAIARALIKNPSILILDEATSALDTVSEQLIQKALENLTKGRTVLTIAHRLSTIRNATSIAVLQDGKIIEQGNYNHLMTTTNGVFRELVERQTFASSKS
ncbi:CLUMA_CG011027, isoform A [Clunio marinus]|uniref:ATP-binding cassette sub-family B member 10, mitochondrial n=1 Tax=Clunio marinus TaxID=568069 RepID=A0A1J1ID24_9DIPT|nr:CLUMA_CG011027, isoform A [Clunio marinus]